MKRHTRSTDQADLASVSYLETADNSLSHEYTAVYDALATRKQ